MSLVILYLRVSIIQLDHKPLADTRTGFCVESTQFFDNIQKDQLPVWTGTGTGTEKTQKHAGNIGP